MVPIRQEMVWMDGMDGWTECGCEREGGRRGKTWC